MNRLRFQRSQLCIPYGLFLVCFVFAPLVVIIYYAFTDGEGQLTLANLTRFFSSPNTIGTLAYSLGIAVATTCCCLLLAYPIAYILARSRFKHKAVILMVFVMPMWINFTLRITALKEILTVIEGNLAFHPFLNTLIGMTYDFLPFMILPLYTSILKMDSGLLEAAADLGAARGEIFWKVMLPLSMPGIVSGVTMVFLPAMTNYVVLDMMYNSTYIMGSLIGSYFNFYDWNNGSMISSILLAMIALLSWLSGKFGESGSREGGASL